LGYSSQTQDLGSLNDEFAGYDGSPDGSLWQAMMLPAGMGSWSFQLVAGADLSAANPGSVLPSRALLSGNLGSVVLGQNAPAIPNGTTNMVNLLSSDFETIRTGTGSIELDAAGSVDLENNLATVYTAGQQAPVIGNFDVPSTDTVIYYPVQYSFGGGNVAIFAQGNIQRLTTSGAATSSLELPDNWLFRRGWIDPETGDFGTPDPNFDPGVNSTSWWIDFSNYFEGVGALGGGNVSLVAGGSINNVDASVPTNERTTNSVASAGGGSDAVASDQSTLELGGGDLSVQAGGDINGGVYYVERGLVSLTAGGSIHSNSTRASVTSTITSTTVLSNPNSWLPTTLFLGQGDFTVEATGSVLLGQVVNPFLLPQASLNNIYYKTYFSTYATSDSVAVSSLAGDVTLKGTPDTDAGGSGAAGSLEDWFNEEDFTATSGSPAKTSEPWLASAETSVTPFAPLLSLLPSSLYATADSGSVNIVGTLILSPAPDGQLSLLAADSINGFQPNSTARQTGLSQWGSSAINLSDASPASIPAILTPLSYSVTPQTADGELEWVSTAVLTLDELDTYLDESGSSTGAYAVLQTEQALHASDILHLDDPDPVEIYAQDGSISGLTLFSAKSADVFAGGSVTDLSLYVQNVRLTDVTKLVAGGSIELYDLTSPLREEAQTTGNSILQSSSATPVASGLPTAGDVQIAGPGAVEVLAGGSINLGIGATDLDGTSVGITTIGNTHNPALPFGGADVVVAAGLAGIGSAAGTAPGLATTPIDFSSFIAQYDNPSTAGSNASQYLPELAESLGVSVPQGSSTQAIWNELLAPYAGLPAAEQSEQMDRLALDTFYLALRDAGREHNDPSSSGYGNYNSGYAAIAALFPGSQTAAGASTGPWSGSIAMSTRLIETTNGGNIDLLAPGGAITVGEPTDPQTPLQGVLTEDGGNISIYTRNDVGVGTSRIFTLEGGDIVTWSTIGSIAAGSGSRTVHAAPPTRVIVDPQSADVKNDLAGLATGSGIGVLATLTNVAPGSVDLIAPVGTIDAGEAGIRASGSINIAALHVLNANNIQSGGTTTGVPVAAAPNIGGLAAASSTAAASASSAAQVANQQSESEAQQALIPSIITIEVLGYGGGDDVTALLGTSSPSS
jgi:hypothetical protein